MLFPFRFHLKQMHSKSISRPHFARSYALKDNITLFVIPRIYTGFAIIILKYQI